MKRWIHGMAAALTLMAGLSGCASKSSAPPPAPAVRQPIPANSPLAKVQTGMTAQQVTDLLGQPTNQVSYESGKRWIPWYYGSDVRRTEWSYKGLGRVIFTGGNQWGAGAGQVERVDYDPNETGVRAN
jgi:outer membrane protein assembly factor BamE (lipoprotein component of BamABCDE complex)